MSARRAPFGFSNPYLQVFISALLVTAAEVFLKLGASEVAADHSAWDWTGINGLRSAWVWAGIVSLVLSFLAWLGALRLLPLNVAYPLANVVHILVPLSSWVFLGESINLRRWCGIALLLAGLLVVAKPVGQIEEQL